MISPRGAGWLGGLNYARLIKFPKTNGATKAALFVRAGQNCGIAVPARVYCACAVVYRTRRYRTGSNVVVRELDFPFNGDFAVLPRCSALCECCRESCIVGSVGGFVVPSFGRVEATLPGGGGRCLVGLPVSSRFGKVERVRQGCLLGCSRGIVRKEEIALAARMVENDWKSIVTRSRIVKKDETS